MAYKSSQVDNLIALRLLSMLCTPFNEFPAYKAGIIDDKGKYIIPSNKRTPSQKRNLTYLDKLVINAKKLINKLPGGENKLKNIISAMVLIKESMKTNAPDCMLDEQSIKQVRNNMTSNNLQYQHMIDIWTQYLQEKKLREEVGVCAIGSGSAPTNNTTGIAYTELPLGSTIIRRRKVN